MCCLSISEALTIYNENVKSKIDCIQGELEAITNTFHALFWLYTHDFLYISPSISTNTSHPYKNFQNHGMVFFQSIIPPRLIEYIYNSMNAQAEQIDQHPSYLLATEFLHVEAAVYSAKGEEIPVTYSAVLLDTKIFDPSSYLVLCSWIAGSGLSEKQFQDTESLVRSRMLEIKKCYLDANSERISFFMAGKQLSAREKEVAGLLSQGHNSKSIGETLHISFNTVESHRKNLLQKLEAKNTAELIYKLSGLVNTA